MAVCQSNAELTNNVMTRLTSILITALTLDELGQLGFDLAPRVLRRLHGVELAGFHEFLEVDLGCAALEAGEGDDDELHAQSVLVL